MRKFFFIFAMIIIPFSLLSAQDSGSKTAENEKKSAYSEENKQSDEVVVRGEAFNVNKSAFTVNTVGSDEIKKKKISKSAEVMKEVPGVEMKSYNKGGVSNGFSVRGFNYGMHSGDMAAYANYVLLNQYSGTGGGNADPNVIVPLEIDKMIIYKGPSSAKFGNFARAGVVVYETKKKGEYVDTSILYDSNKTTDAQIAIGSKITDILWNNTAVQVYRTEGYMPHSDDLFGTASTRFTFAISRDLEVSGSFRSHGHIFETPARLSKEQYEGNNPYDINTKNDSGGSRNQFQEEFDISYKLTNEINIVYWGFGLQEKWSQFDMSGGETGTQNEFARDTKKAGTGIKLNYNDSVFNVISGIEYFYDCNDYQKYTTIQRVRQNSGNPTSDTSSDARNGAVYIESEVYIHRLFRPTLGVRFDFFTGTYENNLTGKEFKIKSSDYEHFSPKAGFISTLVEDLLDFRAGICNGFIIPDRTTTDEVQEAQQIWQYDSSITIRREWMVVDLGGFILDTSNELKKDPSTNEYKTMGKTRRFGFESGLKIIPVSWLEVYGKFTWIKSEILKNADPALEGKEIYSLPRTAGNLGFQATTPWNWGLNSKLTHSGKYYTDSANTEKYNGYNIVDAGLFYNLMKDGKDWSISFDVKNIFDTKHCTSATRSSATSTSWVLGAPRTFQIGVNSKF